MHKTLCHPNPTLDYAAGWMVMRGSSPVLKLKTVLDRFSLNFYGTASDFCTIERQNRILFHGQQSVNQLSICLLYNTFLYTLMMDNFVVVADSVNDNKKKR